MRVRASGRLAEEPIMSHASLRVARLSFAHDEAFPLFSDVSFELEAGWTGVVGRTGAGKSTLLHLLAGGIAPDAGDVRFEPRNVRCVYCPQSVSVRGEDVSALAAREDGKARKLRAVLRLRQGDVDRWSTLSPGERKRWQIGAALAEEPDVLLVDEPTNHLDADARAFVLEALDAYRGLGLVVSHDRELLDALTTKTLRVRGGDVTLVHLPYSSARSVWEAEARERIEAHERRTRERERIAVRLDDARRAQAKAQASRSSGRRMKGPRDSDARSVTADFRVASAEKRIGRTVSVLRGALERHDDGDVPPIERELGGSVFAEYVRARVRHPIALDADALCAGPRAVLRDVHVRVARDERIHLAGPNGAGKTTLLRALARAADEEHVAYLPQDIPEAEASALLADVRALPRDVRGRVLSIVGALGADPAALLASKSPSPGEAQKLRMALALGRHVWALLLDEPTNHLDLPSIERLERALAAFPGAIVLVSHDATFASRCTQTRWALERGRITVA
jgi:ATPase subunit of ABC transporter with duplicated ATPase domains